MVFEDVTDHNEVVAAREFMCRVGQQTEIVPVAEQIADTILLIETILGDTTKSCRFCTMQNTNHVRWTTIQMTILVCLFKARESRQ